MDFSSDSDNYYCVTVVALGLGGPMQNIWGAFSYVPDSFMRKCCDSNMAQLLFKPGMDYYWLNSLGAATRIGSLMF